MRAIRVIVARQPVSLCPTCGFVGHFSDIAKSLILQIEPGLSANGIASLSPPLVCLREAFTFGLVSRRFLRGGLFQVEIGLPPLLALRLLTSTGPHFRVGPALARVVRRASHFGISGSSLTARRLSPTFTRKPGLSPAAGSIMLVPSLNCAGIESPIESGSVSGTRIAQPLRRRRRVPSAGSTAL